MAEDTIPQSGIYAIRNRATGRVYIGSSQNLEKRRKEHWGHLKKHRHHAARLQNSWNKWGAEQFEWVVLEAASKPDLLIREQYWIDHYKSAQPEYGYNSCPRAANCAGVKHTEKARQNMSAVRIGKKLPHHQVAAAAAARKATGNMKLVAKAKWDARTPEERNAIWAKVSATKKAKRAHWTPEMHAANEERLRQQERDRIRQKREADKKAKADQAGITVDELNAMIKAQMRDRMSRIHERQRARSRAQGQLDLFPSTAVKQKRVA